MGNNIQHDNTDKSFTAGLVSVIMPMHNSERYVRESIESVIAQTYPHWELFVVDDNSSDASFAIAQEYASKDERIHVLSNATPIGIPSAPRNTGIKAASGQYISFLDSDDVWFPQKLERQLPLFADSRVAIVYANYEKFNENGDRHNRIVNAPETADYHSLLKGNVIANLTGIYDRAKVGTMLMHHVHHEDYVMWLSILKRGFIAKNAGTTLGGYRLRDSSVSSRKLKTVGWQWRVYRDVEGLSVLASAYNFVFYAWKAFAKSLV